MIMCYKVGTHMKVVEFQNFFTSYLLQIRAVVFILFMLAAHQENNFGGTFCAKWKHRLLL